MSNGVALSVQEGATRTARVGRVEVARERHLRVLPPVPRAYSDPGISRRRAPAPAAEGALVAASRRPAQGWGEAAPLRLTARGRRVVVVLLLLLAVGAAVLVEAALGSGGGGLQLMGTASTVVQPGDTLWSIASEVSGSRDVREVIDHIQALNGLRGGAIEPGQVLRLP